jgi:hypothetical protein
VVLGAEAKRRADERETGVCLRSHGERDSTFGVTVKRDIGAKNEFAKRRFLESDIILRVKVRGKPKNDKG